jgi:hypothetical protein
MDGKIPKGYLPWTGWDPQCPIYYPGPDAAPVDPVEWLPCDKSVVPSAYDCRHMATPWRISGTITALGTIRTSRVNGKLRHWIGRNNYYGVKEGKMFVISEDEGPPLASWYGLLGTCSYLFMTPHEEGFGLGIYRKDKSAQGFFIGNYDSPPPVGSFKITDGIPSNFEAVASGPVRKRKYAIWLTPWSTQQEIQIAKAEAASFATTIPIDDWLILPVGTTSYTPLGTWLWHPSTGVVKLQYAPNDLSIGWSDYGTDLEDAVWTFRSGKEPDGTSYPKNEVYTGKFTTDPAKMLATQKRLRSEPFSFSGATEWKVGCGYAARSVGKSTKLLRLSDGWGWEIKSTDYFSFSVNTVTCDEIRGSGTYAPGTKENWTFTHYRIRLDSLGPPTLPPD